MRGLRGYLLRRIAQLVPVVLLIVTLNFILVKLAPGDPALALAGEWATREQVEATREQWGLNKPLQEQLGVYLLNLAHGDLGFSYHYNQPVSQVLMGRLGPSLILVLTAMVIGMTLGTLIGAYSASRYGTKTDTAISAISLASYSIPVFWLGLILILVLALNLHWFPYSGTVSFGKSGLAALLDGMWHLILPATTLVLALYLPVFLRVARASVIEVMREDHVTTARAAGLFEDDIFLKHILRNALLPIVQMAGVWMGNALTGVVLTETVFSWPGMGTLLYDSILRRDYPVLMGIFTLAGIWVVIAFLIADIVSAYIDPRVSYT